MFFTSYFANLKNLPTEHVTPVSIARAAPVWYKGLEYKQLAPSWSILKEFKETHDEKKYSEQYIKEVLDNLNPYEVREELMKLTEDWQIVLLCYEKPDEFCHRHLVADWLSSYGIPVQEVVSHGFRSRNLI